MSLMKRLSIIMAMAMYGLVAASTASAQVIPPGGSPFSPPLPPPPAAPKIEVPVVPQMDAAPPSPQVQGLQRGSFGDRISRCLDEGAAAGLGADARAAYSRSCANQ